MRSASFCALLLLIASVATASAQPAPGGAVAGVIRDTAGGALPGALVMVRDAQDAIVASVVAGAEGEYRIEGLMPGGYTLDVALPDFASRRTTGVRIVTGATTTLDVVLALRITADVTVSARRTFRNLAEIEGGDLLGVANTASEGLVTAEQLERRPLLRAGEILESVPGLVISQHSGEGKANQYYLRGFNLDHGTDFATTVAGVPVNMPTHAHGQGYSDVNFLIPELIGAVQYQKGLYSAEQGDFATAGASHVRYVHALDGPLLGVSAGMHGWRRVVAAASPRVGGTVVLLAAERAHNDGPWLRPDDYDKTNLLMAATRGDNQNGFSITAMSYRGDWDATDQVPQRAIASGVIPRFGGIDPTTGGRTARDSLSGDWQRSRGAAVTRANAYVLRYRLNLFSNFTYFLDDPGRGDQFEQADRRWVSGGRVVHRRLGTLGARPSELAFGADVRRDAIGEIGLHRTVARQRWSTIRADAVTQTATGLFVQQAVQWSPLVRSSLGLRADRYWFDVAAGNPLNAGATAAGLLSPKGSVVVGPWRNSEVYASAGTGFHSNDARGATIRVDPVSGEPVDAVTPLVRARGAEIGLRSLPRRGLQTTVSLWTLALDSELLFVGDAGTTDAGRPSRRSGIEATAFYAPRPWLTLDADLALSRGRFRDGDPAGHRIPGALERVAAAGVALHMPAGIDASVRLRHFGPRDLTEDGAVRSRPTTIVNAQVVAAAAPRADVVIEAFNLFDARVSDIDYFYTSRLPGEPLAGVADVHSHPAMPRSVRAGVRVRF
jgi:hypothetical protein